MKSCLFPVLCGFSLLLTALAGQAAPAESVRYTETYTEKLVTYRDPDTNEVFPDVIPSGSGSLTATLIIPGLSNVVFSPETPLSFNLGNFSHDDVVENADQTNANSATFFIYEEAGDGLTRKRVGTIKYQRSGNVLTITGTRPAGEENSAVVGDVLGAAPDGEPGQTDRYTGAMLFGVFVGGLETQRVVQYRATRTAVRRSIADIEIILDTINATVELDTTKPVVTITAPANNSRTTNEPVTVRGRVTDNYGIQSLTLTVNDRPPVAPTFEATGNWVRSNVSLAFGTNILRAWAVDTSGNTSVVAASKVFYTQPSVLQLTVQPSGAGTVTGVRQGDRLEAGRGYRATAKPNRAHIFDRWLLETPGVGVVDEFPGQPTLDFIMPPGNPRLTAVFVPNPFPALVGSFASAIFQTGNDEGQGGGDAPPTVTVCQNPVGYINFTLSDLGVVSGQLRVAPLGTDPGGTFPFTTTLHADGAGSLLIPRRAPLSPIDLFFTVNLESPGASAFYGIVIGEGAISGFAARILTTNVPCATNHTVSVTGNYEANPRLEPPGYGAGTLKIDARGQVTVAMNLADGTPLNFTARVTDGNRIPFYSPLYNGRGWAVGQLTCDPASPLGDVLGTVYWYKPPGLSRTEKYFTNGFCVERSLVAWPYGKPPGTRLPFSWTNGTLIAAAGELPHPTNVIFQVAGSRLNFTSNTIGATLTVTPASGLFKGTFKQPGTGRVINYAGALLTYPTNREDGPPGTVGYGWFLGATNGGAVFMLPRERLGD